jgi:hypothetical protein
MPPLRDGVGSCGFYWRTAQNATSRTCTSAFRDLIACLKPFADEEDLGLKSEAETRRRELTQAVAQSVAFEERAAQALAPWPT